MVKNIAIIAALVLCLLVAAVYTEKKNADKLSPSAGATNLVIFLEERPQPTKIRKFVHNGKVHVEILGKPIISPLSLPSGPPAYIFDETGALIDWTYDRGDTPSFVRKWGSFSNATFISVEEAKQLVKGRAR